MSKICTDLEQSRKLLSLGIDKNTADMYYLCDICELNPHLIDNSFIFGTNIRNESVLAWSLTALLKLMPSRIDGFYTKLTKIHDNGWCIEGHETIGEPVDAAFEMVCWLLENGYIKKV